MRPQFGPLASTLLGIAMLGVFALLWGGWRIWRCGDRRKAVLMFCVAVMVAANVAIWSF